MKKHTMPNGRLIREGDCTSTPHTHTTKNGAVVECYHECKSILKKPSFWVMTTLMFPIEHGIWTMVPGLKDIATLFGM